MAIQLQLRRDSAANWTSANPTLLDGEVGYETDTGSMKVGDGATAWASLAYWTGSGSSGDMVLASVQTVTGKKTFGSAGAVGKLAIAGSTSGSTIIDAAATAGSGTVTLPTTGTLATLAGTETLTNKTLTSPTLTTPVLGTPSSGTLTSCTGLPLSTGVTGNLPVANLNSGTSASSTTFWRGDGTWSTPAGTGDVVGPASAVDNAVARFDLTTGKLIQSSAVTIADTTGDITGGKYNTVAISGSSTPTLAVTGTTAVSGTNTGDQTSVTGNAGTATALQTARTINGVSFDGTASITVTAAAGTLTGTTLNSGVTASSLTSVGTIATGVWNGTDIAVADGGTGVSTLTAYAPIFGGTTSTGAVQSGTVGTAGQVLTSNGAGALPTFQSPAGGGNVSNTGTPTSGQAAEWTNATTIQGVAVTGSGDYVKATSPTLTTPTIGVATATSINKVAFTAPATGSTLTIADGKTLTASNTLTFTGTDTSSVAFGGGGTVAYTSNNLSAFSSTTSSQLAGVISDETGSGALVFANTPTLVTPVLGTPTSGTLTNCTGLPVSTGVSGLGTGVATFLATPSSANLISAVTDETGTGALVFANTPTLVTPLLGTPTSGTLTNCTGLPISTGVSGLGTGVATFLATPSSANLASAVTDETGSGLLVFGTSPTITTQVVASGLTASGSGSNNFSGSTGAFQTSSGANTLNGAVTINDATTPSITTAAGKTNTGFVQVNGKTSGALKLLPADATAQTVTVATAAQTTGATTLTIPDMAGSSDTFVLLAKAQTLTNKTLTSPTLTTPVLGTPSSGTLTSCTGLPLSTGVTGNLPVTNLNSGTSASSTTFWRGDGTWATPSGGSGSVATDTIFDAAGDLPVGTGSDTAAKLSAGDYGAFLTANGSSTALFYSTPNNVFQVMEHFISHLASATIFSEVFSSVSSTSGSANDKDHPGVYSISTGSSTATGYLRAGNSNGTMMVGGGLLIYEQSIKIPNLSDGAQTFTAQFGFSEASYGASTGGNHHIKFIHDNTSANWQTSVKNNGTMTTTASSTAVSTGWTKIRIVVNAAASSVSFFVNGTELSSSPMTSNIPDNTDAMSFGWGITKSAGATARTIDTDYVYVYQKLTNPI